MQRGQTVNYKFMIDMDGDYEQDARVNGGQFQAGQRNTLVHGIRLGGHGKSAQTGEKGGGWKGKGGNSPRENARNSKK